MTIDPEIPITFLVVEDDQALRTLTAQIVRSLGYTVFEAESGRAALNSVTQTPPDIVLLDIVLGDMDGLDVCRQIKAVPDLSDCFVVLISGLRTSSRDRIHGLDTGADAYLTRPLSNAELKAHVRSYARLKTAEKKLKLSDERFRNQYQASPVPTLTWKKQDNGFVLTDINEAATGLTKGKAPESLGLTAEAIYPDRPDIVDHLNRCLKEKTILRQETEYLNRGTQSNRVIIFTYAYAPPDMAIMNIEDITERKTSDEQLRQSLKEKETLLQEIHHRVKNNLAVVSGLLRLQMRRLEDETFKRILKDSQDRIQTMALVHEHLYKSENLAEINIRTYLTSLVRSLIQSYEQPETKVKMVYEIADCPVDILQATPLGLLVNELVSNSLKYAFPEGRSGEIRIHYSKDENGQCILRVADNGCGIPADTDWNNGTSLGLRLVKILAENQLDGKLTVESQGGTSVMVSY